MQPQILAGSAVHRRTSAEQVKRTAVNGRPARRASVRSIGPTVRWQLEQWASTVYAAAAMSSKVRKGEGAQGHGGALTPATARESAACSDGIASRFRERLLAVQGAARLSNASAALTATAAIGTLQ